MRLEDVTAEIRPRAPWESIDLGCSLARQHIGSIWKAWALTVFPLWLVLALLLRNHPLLFCLCIWWLKPLYDRVPLMVVSRALFGAQLSVIDVLKAWPKMLVRRIFFALLIGRFSPARSLSLPVAELEGLRGAAYRQRVGLLERNGGEGATLATVAGMLLEVVTGFGLLMFILMMVPGHISAEWASGMEEFFVHDDFSELHAGFFWMLAGVMMFSITIMEPFYVSAGFALYVNSRTLTEGWDIELAFKRLGSRLSELKSGAGSKSGAALLIAALLGMSLSPQAKAEQSSSYREAAEVVMADEDFTIHHTIVQEPVEKKSSDDSSLPDWLVDLFSNVGQGLEFMGIVGNILFWLIITAIVAGLVYLIIRNRHIFKLGGGARNSGAVQPKAEAIMGMDVRPESLPDDIAAAARQAWSDGDTQLAMSLLYRGSIAWLVNSEALPIEESDTEGDCLRRVQLVGDKPYAPYFSNLTEAWVTIAYGKKKLADSLVTDLCDQWPFASNRKGQR